MKKQKHVSFSLFLEKTPIDSDLWINIEYHLIANFRGGLWAVSFLFYMSK